MTLIAEATVLQLLPWCCWPVIILFLLVGVVAALRRYFIPLSVRAIEFARVQAMTGDFAGAERTLQAALQQVAPPSGREEVGREMKPANLMEYVAEPSKPVDAEARQLLSVALLTLRTNPEAFASGQLLQPISGGRRSPGGGSEDAPFGSAQPTIEQALAIGRHDPGGACRLLETALAQMPPAAACVGERGAARFWLQTMLADLVRKSTGDRERELQLLRECQPLVQFLPPDPLGPEPFSNFRYMFHMNRSVAAASLGLYDEAIPALREALAVARQNDTRCKCLSCLGYCLLQQDYLLKKGEAQREAARCTLDQFDRLATGHSIVPLLRGTVAYCRAVLSLYAKPPDLRGARSFLDAALELESAAPHLRAALEALRQPAPNVDQVIKTILFPGQNTPSGGTDQPLPPLSPDI